MMNTIKHYSYKFVENKRVYWLGVTLIDTIAISMSQFAVWFIHFIHRKKRIPVNYTFFEERAQQKVKQIEARLLKKEKQIIEAIYDDYNITTDYRNAINSLIEQAKDYDKKYMSEPHPEATHDIKFPQFISSLCLTHNINPDSIKTIISSSGDIDATATSSMFGINMALNITDMHPVVDSPSIKFFPSFLTLSDLGQSSTWAHETRHLICQHELVKTILVNIIAHITETDVKEIISSKHYNLLKIEHEKQAEIRYNNPQLASLTRKVRSKGYYSDVFFLNHYAQLAKIDELYELPNKLKVYRPIPIQKIGLLIPYKSKSPFIYQPILPYHPDVNNL